MRRTSASSIKSVYDLRASPSEKLHLPDTHDTGKSLAARRQSVRIPFSAAKSHGSDYDLLHPRESKWFTTREYLLLVIEAFLSLAAYVISERNLSNQELARIDFTTRQAMIEMLYWNGYSTILCLVMGCLADSYFSHYTVALFTVILHFAVVSLVLMEQIITSYHINIKRRNPYAVVGWNVCTVTVILIKSTDANRLVYGLQGMVDRKKSAAHLFVFLQFWVSSYATHGGIIVNLFSALFNYTNTSFSTVAFFGCGLSLVAFVYFLHPEEDTKAHRGLGCKVIGCLILAIFYKVSRSKTHKKKGFFDKTVGKFDKFTILRTKEILWLYALLLPTIGICFFKMMATNSLFFLTLISKVKPDQLTEAVGLEQMGRLIKMVFMLVAYFILWPLVALTGIKKTFTNKFLVGHFLVIVFMFCFASSTKRLEIPNYTYNSGLVRIFNSWESTVKLVPMDDFTSHTITVEPMKGVTTSYPCVTVDKFGTCPLFPMTAVFNGTKTNFTMFIHVKLDKTVGYMAIEPPTLVRIRGMYLPLREGPPGTNIGTWPRIYIYNTAETLIDSTLHIRLPKRSTTFRTIVLRAGYMETLTLPPGKYDLSILHADVEKTGVELGEGGVYGILIYPTTFSREITVDTVIEPNTTPSWIAFGDYLLKGLAMGIGNPTLLAMVFNIAPRGLPAMSLSFVASLEGLSMWVSYMGFNTWHRFVTSNVLFIYAFGVTLFYLLCMFVLIRFKDFYS